MRKIKQITATLLVVLLMFTTIPTFSLQARAESNETYEYTISSGAVKITKYIGDATEVVIPSEIDGYKVRTIGSNAFKDSAISSVVIDDNVTAIENNAFYNCGSLQSVTLSKGLKEIGYSVFWGSAIETIEIPESLTKCGVNFGSYSGPFAGCDDLATVAFEEETREIPDYMFSNCSGLKTVTIPDTVTSIGEVAFYECTNLETVTIGGSVKTIGENAFYNCVSLEEIVIPDSVTTIYNNAFYNCSSLQSVTLSKKLKEIGYCVFTGTAIETVEIPKSLSDCGINYSSYSGPFAGCDALVAVTFEEDVKLIPDNLFAGCGSLETVAIPDTVTSIGEVAFYECTNLETVTIGSSVKTIGENAFYNCVSLEEIVIPDSVITIYNNAFYNCSSLQSVTLSKGLKEIGYCIFSGSEIETIEIPASLTDCEVNYSSYSGPFAKCDYLTEVTFEDGIVQIPDYLLAGCEGLEAVTIPDTVTLIGEGAFYDCVNLETVTIGNSVKTIGESAFYNCKVLKEIIIPDSVTAIDNSAFYNCISLQSVTLSKSLEEIGYCVFWGSEIETIEIPKSLTKCRVNYSSYRGPFAGCDYLTDITFEEGTTQIPEYLLSQCTALEDIFIPETVISIGEMAFYNCTYFDDVWFGGTEEDKAEIVVGSDNTVLSEATWHYNSCNIELEHDYDNACDSDCNNCGKVREVPDHVYGDDLICDECGYEKPPYISGDVNDDGSVNNRDYALLMQYLNKWDVTINDDAADVTGDGTINNRDYALLMQYLNKWDVELH